jgi:hypothetical protein
MFENNSLLNMFIALEGCNQILLSPNHWSLNFLMIFAKLLILAATQITVANYNEVDNNNCCFAMFGYCLLRNNKASSLSPWHQGFLKLNKQY